MDPLALLGPLASATLGLVVVGRWLWLGREASESAPEPPAAAPSREWWRA